jgi:hypothetical protein
MRFHDTSGNTGMSRINGTYDNYDSSYVERAKSWNVDEKVTSELYRK